MPSSKRSRFFWSIALVAVWAGCLNGRANAEDQLLRQVIDQRVEEVWAREKVQPAELASDSEFLRRAHLDLLGVTPSYEETTAFLNDTSADKRAKLVDRLLDDSRFAQHQADIWDMVLFGRNPPGYDTDRRDAFQDWLRDQFAKNRPYDEWVHDILRAEGNTEDDGAPMYFVQYKNQPLDAAEAITQTFLGVQLQCARCHDHPFESWSQTDFYGLAAFLSRLKVVNVGKKDKRTKYAIGEMNLGEVLFTGPASEQTPGKKGEPIKPKFLLGGALEEPPLDKDVKDPRNFPSGKMPPAPVFSRKNHLADWITDAKNPYFARAVANRVWAQFMGRGVVHPVNNMSKANPPSHPELLAELTEALIAKKFDLKWYMRELCNSGAYQRSSAGPVEDAKPQWFEQARTRPLSAEELAASWRVATYYDAADTRKKGNDNRYYPLTSGYIINFFGRPTNGVGDFQGGLHEHLYLNNGQVGSVVTSAKGGLVDTLLTSQDPWEERVDRLYLSVLSRRPSDAERQRFVEHIAVESEREVRGRLEEAIWVLLTCSEFRFNH